MQLLHNSWKKELLSTDTWNVWSMCGKTAVPGTHRRAFRPSRLECAVYNGCPLTSDLLEMIAFRATRSVSASPRPRGPVVFKYLVIHGKRGKLGMFNVCPWPRTSFGRGDVHCSRQEEPIWKPQVCFWEWMSHDRNRPYIKLRNVILNFLILIK